MMAVINYNII